MKRITTILSLIAMMLVSGMTYADDINLFLNNRADSTDASTKPQVLFLIDIVKTDSDGAGCPDWPPVDPDEVDQGDGTTTGCESATRLASTSFQVRANVNRTVSSGTGFISFKGMFCTNGFGSHGEIVQTRQCPGGMTLKDPRPIIEEIIRQRPDAKIGVMALNNVKSAKLLLPVESREGIDLTDTFDDLNSNPAEILLDGSSVPTVGGLVKAFDYLKNGIASYSSPLNANCENTQLIILTNGGWKDDAAPNASGSSLSGIALAGATTDEAFLTSAATYLRDKTSTTCAANIITSVIGLDVETDDSTNAPLFKLTGSDSPAKAVALAGGGKFLNTADGKIIVDTVLGMLDYSYPTPSALISPSSPVSASRSHNLSLLFASAFKPEGKIAWPGNMTMGTVAEWVALGMDPTQFDNASSSINGLSDITIQTDLCTTPDATTKLCSLSAANSDILTADDVTWLAGSTLDNNDVFGDPIHFKTLAIHYGNINGDADDLVDHDSDATTPKVHTPDTGELYVLVGTNRGLLHMFEYTTGGTLTHKWAFFPKELERLIPALRNGNLAPSYNMVNHFYGIDGAPSVFLYDQDKDGKIVNTDPVKDRALLYFGLRRGGSTYYALDITSPLAPKLQWSRGKATADYGTKPDADPKLIGNGEPTTENRTVPASSGAPCSVVVVHGNEGFLSSGATSTNPYNELNPSTLRGGGKWKAGYEESGIIEPYTGETYGSFALYTKGIGVSTAPEVPMPVFTSKNQCHYDLPAEGTFTFDAHVLGTGSVTATEAVALKDRVGFKGIMGAGKNPKTTEVGEAAMIVGFDLSSLPSNVYITNAVLTLAHDESSNDNGFKQDATSASNIYKNGLAIFAAKDQIYGSYQVREANTTPDDFGDTNHYEYIGEIKPPASGSYNMGDRTTGGEIFEEKLFEELYDGANGDEYIHALTKLFNSNDTKSSRINDSDYDLAWVQFKIKAVDLDSLKDEFVSYGFPESGELVTNWTYNNGKSWDDAGFIDYWDMVVPKLTLTWTTTAPNDADPGTTDMSITKEEFKTRRGGTTPAITLSVSIEGTGSVSYVVDSTTSLCNTAQCSANIEKDKVVTLTAVVKDGSTFNGWSGCTIDTDDNKVCTVTMSESKVVTASFTTVASHTLQVFTSAPAPGGANLVEALNVTDTQIIAESGIINTQVVAGKQVKLTPKGDTGYGFSSWTGDSASTCGISNPCSFTMNSDISITANFESKCTVIKYEDIKNTTHYNAEPKRATEDGLGSYPNYNYFAVNSGDSMGTGMNTTTTLYCHTINGTYTCHTSVPTDCSVDDGSGGGGDDPVEYNLTTSVTGTGSISNISPTGTSCGDNCATYAENTEVTITASTTAGNHIASWSGCTGDGVDSTSGSCKVIMSGSNKDVGVTFEADSSGGLSCDTATNSEHVSASRAKLENYNFYAIGSGDRLGDEYNHSDLVTSLEETSSDYWKQVTDCN